jgi:hypothetical protein
MHRGHLAPNRSHKNLVALHQVRSLLVDVLDQFHNLCADFLGELLFAWSKDMRKDRNESWCQLADGIIAGPV